MRRNDILRAEPRQQRKPCRPRSRLWKAGHTFFSPTVLEFLLNAALKERTQSRLESFTVRELQVAQLVCEGATNPQIGEKLGITVKTVESHRMAVMRKAEVKTAAALVRFAVKHKLIQA